MGTGPSRRAALTDKLPRAQKRDAGRTETARTPLNVRTTGLSLDESERGYFRVRLGKKLGKFSPHIERVTVRIEDMNGPKGGVDTECRIKVVLSGLPSVLVAEQAETVPLAFNRAADRCVRAVRKALDSSGTRTPKARRSAAGKEAERLGVGLTSQDGGRTSRAAPEGSHVGRRVGRGAANVKAAAARPEKTSRRVPVDTAAPKRAASDRKVGEQATAARNTKLRGSGATYALEDSMQPRPSRKSTRRSANGVKTDSQLRRRTMREVRAPSARASRAAASKGGSRG